jgi:hypothetical protein
MGGGGSVRVAPIFVVWYWFFKRAEGVRFIVERISLAVKYGKVNPTIAEAKGRLRRPPVRAVPDFVV